MFIAQEEFHYLDSITSFLNTITIFRMGNMWCCCVLVCMDINRWRVKCHTPILQ